VHPQSWAPGRGSVLTKVTGQGGIPDGIAAVAVRVTAKGSTAPARISVWAPGEAKATSLSKVKVNGRSTGYAVVPVAWDGTIALATSAGATDLVVTVTSYYLPGDQPNVTTVVPRPV
jgi:hypothetical protein